MPINTPEEKLTSQLLVAAAPLDAKTVVATLAERDAIPASQRYHMMEVKVQEVNSEFILSNATDLTNTGWVFDSLADVPYNEIYVSPTNGNDANPGTRNNPVQTLQQAWANRLLDPNTRYHIRLPENYFPAGSLDLVGTGLATASTETYITGFPGESIIRWGTGWGQINCIDVGTIYFNGLGYYSGIKVEETGISVGSYVSFQNNFVYGSAEIIEVTPGASTLRISGSTGRIDINSLVTSGGTRLDGKVRVDGGATLNLNVLGAYTINDIDAIFGGHIFVTGDTGFTTTIEDLSIRSGIQVNLFRPVLVTNSYYNEGSSLVLTELGSLTIDGGATVLSDDKAESSFHQYDNATSGLTATDVQAALDEIAISASPSNFWKTGADTDITTDVNINAGLFDVIYNTEKDFTNGSPTFLESGDFTVNANGSSVFFNVDQPLDDLFGFSDPKFKVTGRDLRASQDNDVFTFQVDRGSISLGGNDDNIYTLIELNQTGLRITGGTNLAPFKYNWIDFPASNDYIEFEHYTDPNTYTHKYGIGGFYADADYSVDGIAAHGDLWIPNYGSVWKTTGTTNLDGTATISQGVNRVIFGSVNGAFDMSLAWRYNAFSLDFQDATHYCGTSFSQNGAYAFYEDYGANEVAIEIQSYLVNPDAGHYINFYNNNTGTFHQVGMREGGLFYSGSDPFNDGASIQWIPYWGFVKDYVDNSSGGGGLAIVDKDVTAAATTADGQTTGVSITNTPSGYVQVFVNGLMQRLSDGDKTKDCYFSADAGVTAKAISAIVGTDTLYWNGSIAGFQLAVTDIIDLNYIG